MAKAIICALAADKSTFAVTTVYPDGTDLTKVVNPPSGSLIIPVGSGGSWSIGDTVPAETICNGLAVVIASISTVNWSQVRSAIN
jgi:hypothetical protein